MRMRSGAVCGHEGVGRQHPPPCTLAACQGLHSVLSASAAAHRRPRPSISHELGTSQGCLLLALRPSCGTSASRRISLIISPVGTTAPSASRGHGLNEQGWMLLSEVFPGLTPSLGCFDTGLPFPVCIWKGPFCWRIGGFGVKHHHLHEVLPDHQAP